jgi:cobalt/nickel transport protein
MIRHTPCFQEFEMRSFVFGCLFALPLLSYAHFQELIPSADILSQSSGGKLSLELSFTHPMERGPLMSMGEPSRFGVLTPEGDQDLKPLLKPMEKNGARYYQASIQAKTPGDHIFYLEPAPWWEPAEGLMIIHYTKVVVDAFGGGEGWDKDLGLPVEIRPLSRPYGLWTGNLFRGQVLKDGKPVAFAEVEVEWRNDGTIIPPADAYVTQVVKADAQGVFAYAMPRAGWWGFAALVEGDAPMKNPKGKDVPVELGGLIWVFTRDMK